MAPASRLYTIVCESHVYPQAFFRAERRGLASAHSRPSPLDLGHACIERNHANHVPLHLSLEPSPFGTLRGHVARANPIWSDLASDAADVLAIFHGPDAYVTPSWYPTKVATGRVVPTWNYAVAHAYGTLRVVDDPIWLRAHLEAFTAHNESAFPEPWQLDDAPHEFTEQLIQAIVGIEIVISRLTGKWKVSQNQPAENRAGVVRGLRASRGADATAMADLIERFHAAR